MKARFIVGSLFLVFFAFHLQAFQNGAFNYFSALSWVEEIQGQFLTPAFWSLFSQDKKKFEAGLKDFRFSLSENNEKAIEQLIIGSSNEFVDFGNNVTKCNYSNPVSYVKFTNLSRICWAAAALRYKMGEAEEANEILFSLLIFSIRFSRASSFIFFQASLSVCENTLFLIENFKFKVNNEQLKRNLKGQFLLASAIENEWQAFRQLFSFAGQPQNDELKCFKELPLFLQRKFQKHVKDMKSVSKGEVVMDCISCFDAFYKRQIERINNGVFSPEDFNAEKIKIQKSFPELGPVGTISTVPLIFPKIELVNAKLKAFLRER